MSTIKTEGRRGGNEFISGLSLTVNNESYILPKVSLDGQYNIRYVFEVTGISNSFKDEILGEKIAEVYFNDINFQGEVQFKLNDSGDSLQIESGFTCSDTIKNISVAIFHDKPVNDYGVLHTIPVPTEMITVYVCFKSTKSSLVLGVEKYFDGFSHLGFVLADIVKMECIIKEEYGNVNLDLIEEFSNTEIIDKLFGAGALMIIWGINPYTYPIYSAEKFEEIEAILGKPFEERGIYYIDEDINKLSIIPGHELRNWPALLNKSWSQISLQGKGQNAILQPYYLTDNDDEKIISSFCIFREEGSKKNKPLINIDLLY